MHRKHFTSCFSISRKETHGGVNYCDLTCVQSRLALVLESICIGSILHPASVLIERKHYGGVNYDFTCVQSSLVLDMSQHYYSQEIRSVVVITIIIMGVALSVYVQVHLIAGIHKLVHTFL